MKVNGSNKETVEIGGVVYSVGDKTQSGFIVMKPRMMWLEVETLLETLKAREKRKKQTADQLGHRDLRSFCTNCLATGTNVAVNAVAHKKVGNNYSYECLCHYERVLKLHTFSDSFLREMVCNSTRRMPAYVSAGA